MSSLEAESSTQLKPLVRLENSQTEEDVFCDDPLKCGKNHWNKIPDHIKSDIKQYESEIKRMELVVKEILPLLKKSRIEDAISIGILKETAITNTAYHLISPKKRKMLFGLLGSQDYIAIHDLLKDDYYVEE